jgi:cobalt/nickel transport system permease protein
MHIPDGFLGPKTWIGLTIISGTLLAVALKRFKKDELEQRVPLIGVTAAFIFAAQMLNFPVAGGTSGHFMGGVLACMLLGPWTGFIAMALVLTVQALIFQDGGLTTLGANIFNMGLIGSVGGFFVYFTFRLLLWGDRTRPVAYALAAWISIMLSALFAALELSVSGTVKWSVGIPAMLSIHAIIGVFEAIITTTALMAIWRTRPELMMLKKY